MYQSVEEELEGYSSYSANPPRSRLPSSETNRSHSSNLARSAGRAIHNPGPEEDSRAAVSSQVEADRLEMYTYIYRRDKRKEQS